ncbi:MAG: hypothetical protein ACRDF0_00220 [Candidatus Limnocylindria bacterium]
MGDMDKYQVEQRANKALTNVDDGGAGSVIPGDPIASRPLVTDDESPAAAHLRQLEETLNPSAAAELRDAHDTQSSVAAELRDAHDTQSSVAANEGESGAGAHIRDAHDTQFSALYQSPADAALADTAYGTGDTAADATAATSDATADRLAQINEQFAPDDSVSAGDTSHDAGGHTIDQ